ncbi:nucleoside triphosphate pyrophosphohydrolase [Alterisphingorhabdus coralli]|uniref:Nucleoside triphosphate pyrophosphohydrolase n=1 Tax=Alterisphingorhabdus coralli TaxID=3071408 RepID=A0AA97F4A6_9SPHN|nr:nucleoside triphosphate pyrophosphohydrolase [Parasphingorhabdus sp. SCSIO 66989]WOE74049.1 nucleoside triphosphate pyrophosphohydrolase [Parasphingorhabdus sp. SCSIO 66989]
MQRLRDPDDGCPWDLAQDFSTIAPYTVEEAYEVADAIDRDDMDDLRGELGDLLLQVVFHSQMASEAGHFTLQQVIDGICGKMIARHPHIFADQAVEQWDWEDIKKRERAEKGMSSALDGVAQAQPALMRAEKLQKRAARTGFDWPQAQSCAAKLEEEMAELADTRTDVERHEEAGDLLFAAVNLVRHYGVDPETALRDANRKFERRFKAMESEAKGAFETLSLDEQEALWQQVKRSEAKTG